MPLDDSESRNQSGPTNEERLDVLREYKRYRRTVDEANNLLRGFLKRVKAEGHNTKSIIDTAKAEKQDPDVVKGDLRDTLRLMALRNVISLDDAIAAADDLNVTKKAREADDTWDAEDKGYRSGRHGADRGENPYSKGSELHATWDGWWLKGKKAIERELGPQEKLADSAKEKPTRGKAAETKALTAPENGAQSRGRGRPKGSGNKSKLSPKTPKGAKAKHDPIPDPPTTVVN